MASFYTFFRSEPRGAYEILLSDNITDHLLGKAGLMQYLCEKLWIEPGKVSEDGLVSVWNTARARCSPGLSIPAPRSGRLR